MIADINDSGPANVRYIHWSTNEDFEIAEILCYERKRLFPH